MKRQRLRGSAHRINSGMHYLWRAVDNEGEGLERYLTKQETNPPLYEFSHADRP